MKDCKWNPPTNGVKGLHFTMDGRLLSRSGLASLPEGTPLIKVITADGSRSHRRRVMKQVAASLDAYQGIHPLVSAEESWPEEGWSEEGWPSSWVLHRRDQRLDRADPPQHVQHLAQRLSAHPTEADSLAAWISYNIRSGRIAEDQLANIPDDVDFPHVVAAAAGSRARAIEMLARHGRHFPYPRNNAVTEYLLETDFDFAYDWNGVLTTESVLSVIDDASRTESGVSVEGPLLTPTLHRLRTTLDAAGQLPRQEEHLGPDDGALSPHKRLGLSVRELLNVSRRPGETGQKALALLITTTLCGVGAGPDGPTVLRDALARSPLWKDTERRPTTLDVLAHIEKGLASHAIYGPADDPLTQQRTLDHLSGSGAAPWCAVRSARTASGRDLRVLHVGDGSEANTPQLRQSDPAADPSEWDTLVFSTNASPASCAAAGFALAVKTTGFNGPNGNVGALEELEAVVDSAAPAAEEPLRSVARRIAAVHPGGGSNLREPLRNEVHVLMVEAAARDLAHAARSSARDDVLESRLRALHSSIVQTAPDEPGPVTTAIAHLIREPFNAPTPIEPVFSDPEAEAAYRILRAGMAPGDLPRAEPFVDEARNSVRIALSRACSPEEVVAGIEERLLAAELGPYSITVRDNAEVELQFVRHTVPYPYVDLHEALAGPVAAALSSVLPRPVTA